MSAEVPSLSKVMETFLLFLLTRHSADTTTTTATPPSSTMAKLTDTEDINAALFGAAMVILTRSDLVVSTLPGWNIIQRLILSWTLWPANTEDLVAIHYLHAWLSAWVLLKDITPTSEQQLGMVPRYKPVLLQFMNRRHWAAYKASSILTKSTACCHCAAHSSVETSKQVSSQIALGGWKWVLLPQGG